MLGCRPLTQNETDLILESLVQTRDKALFVLNLYTGFRIQESLSLKVCDVVEFGKIVDRVTVKRSNMKGKISSRSVLLHPNAKRYIGMLIAENNLQLDHYLFKSRKGPNQAISRIQAWKILRRIVLEHKLTGKVALHSTRKVFAEKMHKHFKGDIIKTSKALGHKHLTSTVSYLSFKTEEVDNAILTMDQIDTEKNKE